MTLFSALLGRKGDKNVQTYCISRCLSIRHGGGMDNGKAHSHTIEVLAYIGKEDGAFEPFFSMEQVMDSYLSRYEGRFINVLPEFDGDGSIERMGEVFFAGLSRTLAQSGLYLERLEVGETPLRRYIVGRLDGAG